VSVQPIRVVLVDDDERMRSQLAAVVSADPRLMLMAMFDRMRPALAWVAEYTPGVLLVDLGLPDGSGLDLIRTCPRLHDQCEIMVVSMFADEVNVLASIEAGALGYVHKDAADTDIVEAIVSIRSGGSPMSPSIARRMLKRIRSAPGTGLTRPAASSATAALTPRETEILNLISRDYSYQEAAADAVARQAECHVPTLFWSAVHQAARTDAARDRKSFSLDDTSPSVHLCPSMWRVILMSPARRSSLIHPDSARQ
jgi:DNA-binding NarL/FixJ family response regulator